MRGHLRQQLQDARDARAATDRARDYELAVTETTSLVGDPALLDDQAYLGHMCNDGASCSSLEARGRYATETARACNAAFFPMEGCARVSPPTDLTD